MSTRVYTGDQIDGTSLGASGNDPVCLYNSGPVPQRANGLQAPVVPTTGAQVVTYQQTLTPASVAANTTAEQSLTIGTTAGNGPLTTDFVAAINKQTAQAGLGIHGARISAANTLYFAYSNNTTAALTPTAAQVYNVALLRNMPIHSQTLTPAAIPGSGVAGVGTVSEQTFALTPVLATGTATVNNAGQITGVTMVANGSNYITPPTVVFTDTTYAGASTMAGSNIQYAPTTSGANTTANPQLAGNSNINPGPGKGATGLPIMSSTGTVLGVQMTNLGSGYTSGSVNVTFLGGNAITPGMAVAVTKPSTNAGVAVANARVVANNQIAITYVNMTSAAVTPTSEAYTIAGLNTLPPCNHVTSYGVVGTGLVSVASQTSAEQSLTVNGLLATDIVVGVSKPTLSAGIIAGNGRVSAANTLYVPFINASGAAVTPSATEIYGVTTLSQTPLVPFTVLTATLTPTSVAANTSAEQTFTVTPLPFINSSPSTVIVNKPSMTPGLVVGGARVTAANTLGLNFMNVTATTVTPVAETYTIGVFNAVGPGGGAPGSWVALCARTGDGQALNLVNELQQGLSESGIGALKGSV